MPEQTVELIYRVGDQVETSTDDRSWRGEVRAVFTTRAGNLRFVVEYAAPARFLKIFAPAELRPLDRDLSRSLVSPHSPTTGNGDES